MTNNISSYITTTVEAIVGFLPSLLMAILAIILGFWIANKLTNILTASLHKSSLSVGVASFVVSFATSLVKLMAVLIAAGLLGFDTSAIVGILAAAGFAVGLALQGGLGNFASGIIILLFKPYQVGDWIEVDGKFGKVEEIQIFNTIIITPGLKSLIIPNGQVTENIVTNFSKKGMTRLELKMAIPYSESFPRVKKIIDEVLQKNQFVLNDPQPIVGIEEYDTHFITIGIKPFVLPDNFWPASYEINQAIKNAFHQHNVKMAYSEGVELGDIGE